MNHGSSFLIRGSSIIGRNISDLVSSNGDRSNISIEMRRRGLSSMSVSGRDDTFFRMDDPEVDPVQVVDVLHAIPLGKFHYLMIVVYFTLFLSTSTLAFNFAFFLMP